MPDPNLIDAANEIAAILKRRDIAAVCVFASQTHCHYLNKVDPSWSCAKFETGPDGREALRIKATQADYGSKEARNKALSDTAGIFLGFVDVLKFNLENCEKVIAMIGKNVASIEHSTTEEEL